MENTSPNKNNPEFIEENNKLKALVSEIEYLFKHYKQFSPYPNISEHDVGDSYEDIDDLNYKKSSNRAFYKSTVEPWKEHIDSPYFGRLDLDINGDFKSIYIGEKDLYDSKGKLVVVSGRSDIGDFFKQTNLEKDTSKGNTYEAFLRRNLLIKNRHLLLMTDSYVKGFDTKYNGLTDPYLMEVLKWNRKEKGMHSILSSIQENQFKIVNQDPNKSFIVQGCAGSGKTAILFQRLARIEYRNKGFVDNKVRFITPNSGFNLFVDPLAKSLDLQYLTPITLDDYYLELARRYHISFPVKDEEIENDFGLDSGFLKDVYSDSTIYSLLLPLGKKYIDDVFDNINYDELVKALSCFDIKEPEANYRYCLQRIEPYIRKACEFIETNVSGKFEKIKTKIDPAFEIFAKYLTSIEEDNRFPTSDDVEQIKQDIFVIVEQINDEIRLQGLESIQQLSLDDSSTMDDIFDIPRTIEIINNEIRNLNSKKKERIKELEFELGNINDDAIEKEWEEVTLPSLLTELEDLKTAQSNLAFFSFIRRQKITNRIKEIEQLIEKHDKGNSSLIEQKGKITSELQILNASKEYNEIPDTLIEECKELISLYDASTFLLENSAMIQYGEYLIRSLSPMKKIIGNNKLAFTEMYKKVMIPVVTTLCSKHNLEKAPNSVRVGGVYHTFNVYLTLSLAYLFLNKPAYKDKFICFDEGQEYSSNEYMLIMDINSSEEEPVLVNVYGDINQKSSPKGLSNWKEIPFVSDVIFELKENYRNSKEIVDYTNRELNLSDIAIGIDEGIPVTEINFNEALNEIAKGDICVILKKDSLAYSELESRKLTNKEKNGIIVTSPFLAKGQEFPKVIVFAKNMDRVDKYVSFTRAKSQLLVCKDF